MPYAYHCESFWPKKQTRPTSEVDTAAVGRWLTEMSAAGWDLISVVKVDDKVAPSEMLYYLRRDAGTA